MSTANIALYIKQHHRQYLRLLFGFVILASGTAFTLYSNLGMNPWGTFHEGVSLVSGLSFGTVTQLTGLAVILFSLFFRIRPGIGTVLNMIMIGWIIDMILSFGWIPPASSVWIQYLYLVIGILLFNYGIYLYLTAKLGAGPRDGLMIGLVKMTGVSVSIIRPAMEITVIVIGVLLGGQLGPGTIINGIGGGYVLNLIFRLHQYDPKKE